VTAASSPAPHPAICNITASTTSTPQRPHHRPNPRYLLRRAGHRTLHLRLPQYPDLPTKTRQLGLQHLHRPQHHSQLKRLHLPNPPHPPLLLILHLDRAELESEQKNLLHSITRACLRVILNRLSHISAPSAYFPLTSTAPGANTTHAPRPRSSLRPLHLRQRRQ
jgi:hypothetical protein